MSAVASLERSVLGTVTALQSTCNVAKVAGRGGMEKKSSAAAWNWKWGHKLGPENYFSLPEIYSETGFGRLRVSV